MILIIPPTPALEEPIQSFKDMGWEGGRLGGEVFGWILGGLGGSWDILGGLWVNLGRFWGGLERILEGLGGVLEGLGGPRPVEALAPGGGGFALTCKDGSALEEPIQSFKNMGRWEAGWRGLWVDL